MLEEVASSTEPAEHDVIDYVIDSYDYPDAASTPTTETEADLDNVQPQGSIL
jgi:hypothetical protein